MRTLVLAFFVFLFFVNSAQAALVPQSHTEKIPQRKWVTVHIIGIMYAVKMFLNVNETCGNAPRTDAQIRCYQDYGMLPVESELPDDNEMEFLSVKGAWVRSTQDAYCAIHDAQGKTNQQYQPPCYVIWEHLKKKKTNPERLCNKIDTYFERKPEIRCYS